MVGNLMGDFRKYLGDEVLPDKVNLGIKNHLLVDKYTDSNPIVLDLKRLFSSERHRFAGIIIDVTFDYFLSLHWQNFSDKDRGEFIDETHRNIISLSNIMPERMQLTMNYMIRDEWLRSYARLEGVGYALDRMSARIRFENKLAGAIEEIESNYQQLEEGFLQFFPTLVEHVDNKIEIN